MNGPEHMLRWLRTLSPEQAKTMLGHISRTMPDYTIEWVREGRRLVMDEGDEEIAQIFGLLKQTVLDAH